MNPFGLMAIIVGLFWAVFCAVWLILAVLRRPRLLKQFDRARLVEIVAEAMGAAPEEITDDTVIYADPYSIVPLVAIESGKQVFVRSGVTTVGELAAQVLSSGDPLLEEASAEKM